jgi:hypothetical protein
VSRFLDLLLGTSSAGDDGDSSTAGRLSPQTEGAFSAQKAEAQSLCLLSPLSPHSKHEKYVSGVEYPLGSSQSTAGDRPRELTLGAEKGEKAEKGRNAGVSRAEKAPQFAEKAPLDRDPASDWRDFFAERAAMREFGGLHTRAEAEALAWAELQNRWHLEHGDRVPRDLCAGCRRPIGEASALDLTDGSRVHLTDTNTCLIQHGKRWRANATRALMAVGL